MSGDEARDAILGAVDAATDAVRDGDPDAAHATLARDYRSVGALDGAARLDRFEGRLVDYGVDVVRLRAADVADALGARLDRRRAAHVVVPRGTPDAWRPAFAGRTTVRDDAPHDALEAADATVSGCAVAVAETGTIALDGGPGMGRRAASLLPDVHLCVVRASQVVELLPEAQARLQEAAAAGAPITWISGPSATSDIELERVAGVHGPRTLVVLLVEDA